MPATHCIYIFGDSIAYGEWDSQGGWVNRLRYILDQNALATPANPILAYNLSIPNETSAGILSRFENELSDRARCQNQTVNNQIIIAIGANDSGRLKTTKQPLCSVTQFTQNLLQITRKASKYQAQVYFVGLAPCNEEASLKASKKFAWTQTYTNEGLFRYDQAIRQVCQKHQISFIDIYDAFNRQADKALLSPDGLHPNDQGHELIFNQLISRLDLDLLL